MGQQDRVAMAFGHVVFPPADPQKGAAPLLVEE
jgi:hypothetical protein